MPEHYLRRPNTNCCVCNKPVYRRPLNLKVSGGRVYCSQACYGISCRKEVSCKQCGTKILASKCAKTCSRACANKQRAGITYNGRRPKDNVVTQRILKVRLLEQRGKLCERCGYDKYQILQVHHKDRNRQHNSLENLELICPNCHFEEHLLEKSWLNKIDTELGGIG